MCSQKMGKSLLRWGTCQTRVYMPPESDIVILMALPGGGITLVSISLSLSLLCSGLGAGAALPLSLSSSPGHEGLLNPLGLIGPPDVLWGLWTGCES